MNDERDQILAKLRGLERLLAVGMIDEPTYQAKQADLQARLDALGPAPRTLARHEAPPLPPPPEEVVAPPPALVVSAPAEDAGDDPLVALGVAPAPAVAPRAGARRGVLAASSVAATLVILGAVVAVLATRGHNSDNAGASTRRSPVATPSPDPDAALTALRTSGPSRHDAMMDASDAVVLVNAFWPARERALSNRDQLAVRGLETGAAAEWDVVGCNVACAPVSPRSIGDLRVYVPRQAQYPASFLAEVLTTAYQSTTVPMVELMVFTRPSGDEPWSLALDTGFPGIKHIDEYPVPVEGGAFDAAAPRIPGVDPAGLPTLLASYWQHWADTGSAPPGSAFLPGPFTDKTGQAIHETLLEDRARGVADTASFNTSAGDPLWTFAVREAIPNGRITDGWALTCGTGAQRKLHRTPVVELGHPTVGRQYERPRLQPSGVPAQDHARVTLAPTR